MGVAPPCKFEAESDGGLDSLKHSKSEELLDRMRSYKVLLSGCAHEGLRCYARA